MQNIQDTLVSSQWNAGLEYYDFLHQVKFRPDGTGQMMSGCGQTLHLQVNFRWRILDDNKIEFEFLDTENEVWEIAFHPTEMNAKRVVDFELCEGPFGVEEPYVGKRRYHFLLRFSASPFPVRGRDAAGNEFFEGDDFLGKAVEFYGHPVYK